MTSSPPFPSLLLFVTCWSVSWRGGGEGSLSGHVTGANREWILACSLSLPASSLCISGIDKAPPPYTSPPPSSHSGETSSVGPQHADRRDRSSTSYT